MGAMGAAALAALGALVLQNTAVVLLMRLTQLRDAGQPQATAKLSAIVLATEATKLVCSLAAALVRERRGLAQACCARSLTAAHARLAALALLYLVQNALSFTALSHLEPAIYQVVYQLKVVFGAVLARVILGRAIPALRWLAVVLLFLGVNIVAQTTHLRTRTTTAAVALTGTDDHELDEPSAMAPAEANSARELLATTFPLPHGLDSSVAIGIGATVLAATLSGLSGTLMELVLKAEDSSATGPTFWVKNAQLAAISTVVAWGMCFSRGGVEDAERALFSGFDEQVVMLVGLQAAGGLLNTIVLKLVDNVAKGFATSLSMVLSGLLSVFILDFVPSSRFVLGASIVTFSVLMYAWAGKAGKAGHAPAAAHKKDKVA